MREIATVFALLVSIVSLFTIYIVGGCITFLLVVGYCIFIMRVFRTRKVAASWESAFFVCFVLYPVVIALEVLII